MNKTSGAFRVATLALCASACSIVGTALAQSQASQELVKAEALPMDAVRAGRFHFMDVNGDGFLTLNEIPADDVVARSQFGTLDRNDDGRLTLEEFAVYGKPGG